MRVVELAKRLGMGVGETVELCRRAGIDVRLGIDELRSDEINVLSTLFKLDLVAGSVDVAVAPVTVAAEAPAWARPQPEPAPPPPPVALQAQLLPADPVRDDPWATIAGAVATFDEGNDPLEGERDDDHDHVHGDRPQFATLSGRRAARRRRWRTDRSADESSADFSELIDDRWIPVWIRRLVLAAAVGGLAVMAIVAFGARADESPTEEAIRESAELVAGACFDYAGAALVNASCLDTHDGQIVLIIEYDGETSYTGAEGLLADARVRCANDPAVAEVLARVGSAVRLEAQVPSQVAWESGDRTTYCILVSNSPVPLSGSLL